MINRRFKLRYYEDSDEWCSVERIELILLVPYKNCFRVIRQAEVIVATENVDKLSKLGIVRRAQIKEYLYKKYAQERLEKNYLKILRKKNRYE